MMLFVNKGSYKRTVREFCWIPTLAQGDSTKCKTGRVLPVLWSTPTIRWEAFLRVDEDALFGVLIFNVTVAILIRRRMAFEGSRLSISHTCCSLLCKQSGGCEYYRKLYNKLNFIQTESNKSTVTTLANPSISSQQTQLSLLLHPQQMKPLPLSPLSFTCPFPPRCVHMVP